MIRKVWTALGILIIISLSTACNASQLADTSSGGINTPETSIVGTTVVGLAPVGTVQVSSSTVEEIVAQINQYVASGDITGNAENGLLAKLDTINQKILKGQNEAAANQFGALINEVQAQQGKKISAEAASELIALVQQGSAEILSAVLVTAGTATSLPPTEQASTTALSTSAAIPVMPLPRGDKLQHQAQWDTIASSVAKLVGFSTFSYDLYKLPANTTWVDTLAYYDTQAAAAGWGATHNQIGEVLDGHFALWKMNSSGTTYNFVVVQLDTTEGSFTLNLLGQ